MANLENIKARAESVKDATQVGENTAERVGGVLVDLVDAVSDNASKTQTNLDGKVDKSAIAQKTGDAIDKVMSQQATTDELSKKADKVDMYAKLNDKADKTTVNDALLKKADAEEVRSSLAGKASKEDLASVVSAQSNKDKAQDEKIASKADAADVTSQIKTEQTRVNDELEKKFDKASLVQETGNAEDKVMSQKAVSDKLSDLSSNASSLALLKKQTISKNIITGALNTPNMDIVAGRAYKITAKTSIDIKKQVTFGIADDTQFLIVDKESSKLVDGVSAIARAKYSKQNSAFFFIFDGDTDVDVELTIEDVTEQQNTQSIQQNTQSIQQNTQSIQQNTQFVQGTFSVSSKGESGRKHLFELTAKAGHVYKVIAKPSKSVNVDNIVIGFNRVSDNSTVVDILQITKATWTDERESSNSSSAITKTENVYVKLYSSTNDTDVDVELTIEDVTEQQNTQSIHGRSSEIFSSTKVLQKGDFVSIPFNDDVFHVKKNVEYELELSANSNIKADWLYLYASSIKSGSVGTDYKNANLLNDSKEWDGKKKTIKWTFSQDLDVYFRIVVNSVSAGENAKVIFSFDTHENAIYGLENRFKLLTTKERYSLPNIEGISVIDKDIKKECLYLGGKWYSNGKQVDILNPLYKYGADPDFIEVNGTFYIVASEIDDKQVGAIVFLRTKDWLNFENLGNPITKGDGPTDEQYWAPDIACVNGKYVIYMSANSPRRIIAYVADKPEGPYKYYKQDYSSGSKDGIITSDMGLTLTDTTLIDPNFFQDPVSKEKYLFFGSYLSTTGKCYGIKMAEDGLSIKSGAKTFCVSNIKAEGTNNFYKDGKYYLFCSIGAWGYASYQTVYGVSDSVEGPYLTKEGKSLSDADNPSYNTLTPSGLNGRLYGIGHNGAIFKDAQGRYYMVIHAWDRTDLNSKGEKTSRQICLVEIKWDSDGYPYIDNYTDYLKFPAPVL